MRTIAGKALAQWREELIADLDGADNISNQQMAGIDLTAEKSMATSTPADGQ